MNLKEKLAEAKSRLAEVKDAVENGEKGADELAAAIEDVKDARAKVDAANEAQELIKSLGNGGGDADEEKGADVRAKSIGEHFINYRKSHPGEDNRVIATPFKAAGDPTTSAGLAATEYDREPVRRIAAPLTVLDLFGRKNVSEPVYAWNAYKSTTGSAGATAEGASKNRLAYDYEQKSATLKKVTGLIKVTEELFDDAAYIVDAINQDLIDDLNAARQAQAVADLLATSGVQVDAVAKNASDVDLFKAILKAAAAVEDSTRIAADAVIVTPAIWLRLRSALNGDGDFYAGSPFGTAELSRLFEMQFVKSADVTANHIIVGAFAQGADLVSKAEGVRIDSTNSNDVDFEKNLVSIRAEAREVLAVKRPACFCDITVAAE